MGLFDGDTIPEGEAMTEAECADMVGPIVSGKVSDPFDLESVKARFNAHLETVNSMLDQANEYRILDQAGMENAVVMLGEAVTLGKKLEVNRKSIVDKPNKYVKFVNSLAKTFYDTNPKTKAGLINKIEAVLKKKITEFTLKQELERREKEKKAQEAAKALQAAIDKEAKEKGIETVNLPSPVVPQIDKVTRGESGASVTMARPWKAEVVDAGAVERQFCSPDMKKINEAVKAGMREAPGLKIYQDTQVKLRV